VVPASEQLGDGELGVGWREAVVDLALEALQLGETLAARPPRDGLRSGRPSKP
jgi:hypothetical protein